MKMPILKIYWLVLLVLIFSGCSIRNLVPDKNVSWQEEVVMAKECGMDGLMCCPDTDPPCLYGMQCCTDSAKTFDNFCSDDCSCGKKDKFCCQGEKPCDAGMACVEGRCRECGNENNPCCAGDICSGDLVCYQAKCFKCGFAGNPCCAKEPFCENENKTDLNRTECREGTCALCGSGGNRSCSKEPFCIKSHLFNNDVCFPCGGFNQPCCDNKSDVDYICDPEKNLVCDLGFCNLK